MDTGTPENYHYSPENYQRAKNTLLQSIHSKTVKILTGIDGYAATGKGWLVEQLEREFGYKQFSNGNTVRAFTWLYLSHFTEFDLEDGSFDSALRHIRLMEVKDTAASKVGIYYKQKLLEVVDPNSVDPLFGLRSPKINEIVATISPRPAVVSQIRWRLQYRAKKSSEQKVPFVSEGRDNYYILRNIPHALLIYITASDEVISYRAAQREAKKRSRENKPPLTSAELAEVVQRTLKRNKEDAIQPLGFGRVKTPEEAVEHPDYKVIDTSELSKEAALYAVIIRQLLHLGITPDIDSVATQPTDSPTAQE